MNDSGDSENKTLNPRVVIALLAGLAVILGGLFLPGAEGETTGDSSPAQIPTKAIVQEASAPQFRQRLISLSPGVTDTIAALGRKKNLVGVSDYCNLEKESRIEKVGSAITPKFEAIARLEPDLIITSQVAGDGLAPLSKLAPTLSLPWLTLDEWLTSISILGVKLDKKSEAQALAQEIRSALSPLESPDPPRVLFALDYGETGAVETWFLRRNSIHGAVLEAAGAINAVQRDVEGQPKLSAEQLLKLNPDAIVVLRASPPDEKHEERTLAHYRKWSPLEAVKNGRIKVLSIPGALTIGPGVLTLIPKLRAALDELFPPSKGDSPARNEAER